MKKVINDRDIEFYDDTTDELIMHMSIIGADFIWSFESNDPITITEDMELYKPLKQLMSNDYEFSSEEALLCYKDDNKLIWYSDCYYNPDNEFDKKRVSYLTVIRKENSFQIRCTNPLRDEGKRCPLVVGFSPSGNGRYALNVKRDSSILGLQSDFVKYVYLNLMKQEKVKKI